MFKKKMIMETVSDQPNVPHQSRHPRLLKKHIMHLENTSQLLQQDNKRLKLRLLKVEEELGLIKKYLQSKEHSTTQKASDGQINSNEIQDDISLEGEKMGNGGLRLQQPNNIQPISHTTKQISNFDKLHLSMLELLEDVESIENKVDVSIPEFRKEISKLEIQGFDTVSKMSLLMEDQTNTRESVKAIGVSVSNLKDKTDVDRIQLSKLADTVNTLMKSASVQASKLHDHILKVTT